MSIYIISAIVILLVLAGSYALIHNTLERKRLQRQRLIAALKVRQRNLHHMATGFPPHFLSPDLMMLIVRAQIDACEQLIKIEPRNPDRKSTRLNSSHVKISYAVFCLKKKKHTQFIETRTW